jgi:DNA replication and repair protein RecF
MILKRLDVARVRNIGAARLELADGLNVIVGPNGSGKSSLLEAFYLLGTGQSFRTSKTQDVVTHGEDGLTVFGLGREEGLDHRVGIRKGRDGSREIAVDGRSETGRGRLAKLLPMTVITPDSHRIVSGGPGERRAYLDWIVFHVEQGFHEEWSVYQRALRQRNEALKRGAGERELEPWEDMLGRSGESIDRMRRKVLEFVGAETRRYAMEIEPEVGEIGVEYSAGWAKDKPLLSAIRDGRPRDLATGHTGSGPHRADLELTAAGANAAATLSRGQQKALVVALKLAGIAALVRSGTRRPALLFDDVPSELDERKRKLVMDAVAAFGCQTVVTATDARQLPAGIWSESATFHVEQGRVHKLV